jgi:hypothetical protein
MAAAFGDRQVIDWGPSSSTYTLDLSGVFLPDFVTPPAFDTATGRVSWSEAPPGVAPDATVGVLEISRPDLGWTWVLFAPHRPGELTLPRLPTDVHSWNPTAGDMVSIDHVENMTLTGGYDALRTRVIDFGGSDLTLATGPAGRIVDVSAAGSQLVNGQAAALHRARRPWPRR